MANRKRLEILSGLLRKDAANPSGVQFNLGTWGKTSIFNAPENALTLGCETQACAIGLACLSPELQAEGLNYKVDYRRYALKQLTPIFGNHRSWSAVCEFFEIDGAAASHLFSATQYGESTIGHAAELAVADRIDEFLKSETGS